MLIHFHPRRTSLAAALAVALASAFPLQSNAAIAYTNNFEANTTGFSAGTQNLLPTDAGGFASANRSNYLGLFAGTSSTTLSLTGLSAGTTYDLDFDLFAGRSLDGSSTIAGPDTFRLQFGATSLVDATFNNLLPADGILNNFTQTYSDATPTGGGAFAPYTGADVSVQTGDIFSRYGIYYFGHGAGNPQLTFTATAPTATLTFSALGLQDASDEFFDIDNVVITSVDVPSNGRVPDSGLTVVLFGIALLAMAFFRRLVVA